MNEIGVLPRGPTGPCPPAVRGQRAWGADRCGMRGAGREPSCGDRGDTWAEARLFRWPLVCPGEGRSGKHGPVCTRRRRPRRGFRLEAAHPVALCTSFLGVLISALAKLLGLLSPRDVTLPGPTDARTGWWLRRRPAEGTPLAPDPMAGPSEHLWTVEDARLRAGTTEAAASSVRV